MENLLKSSSKYKSSKIWNNTAANSKLNPFRGSRFSSIEIRNEGIAASKLLEPRFEPRHGLPTKSIELPVA